MNAVDTEYEVIVVGARCAGSPLAMQLASQGHTVLVVDRSTFPSDALSTHFIQMSGIRRLERWGLLDAVLATGCPPVRIGRIDFGAEPLEAETFGLEAGLPGNLAPRRFVLDKILVDAARAAGAEVREGVFVTSLIRESGRVAGIEGRGPDGEPVSARARFVVGADGRNSVVAREVSAEAYEDVGTLGWGYYSYWSGVECDRAEIYLLDGRFAVMFPTNDGLTTVAVAFPTDAADDARKRPEEKFLEGLDAIRSLGERMRAGRREEKIYGLREVPNFLKAPYGPGWALAGDAGHHKDPQPAQGISDAFRDSEQLANALHEALVDPSVEDEALRNYHSARDAWARPSHEKTVTMATFTTPPEQRAQMFLELGAMDMQDLAAMGADSAEAAS